MSAVTITGASVLTPLGDSLASVHDALCEGKVALAARSEHGGAAVAAMRHLQPALYTHVPGIGTYNRTTQLAICAARTALEGARLPDDFTDVELGVVMASTSGHLDALLDHDRSIVVNGAQRTNMGTMPLALPSTGGALVALACGAKAFALTVGDGGASSLDALGLAARWVATGRARACLVVGAFSAAPLVARAIARSGALSMIGDVRPFDRASSGSGLGEGAAAFLLERADDASARGADVHGSIEGWSTAYSNQRRREEALDRASRAALGAARRSPAELALVSASASGQPDLDQAEAFALLAVLAEDAPRIPVMAIHGALGDTFDAAGALQVATALMALRRQTAPRIARLAEPRVPGLAYLRSTERLARGASEERLALVTSVGRDGSCSALVLSGAVR